MKVNLVSLTYPIEQVVEQTPFNRTIFSVFQIFSASVFLIFCSQLSLPLYFSLIPLSLQTFGIMLVGACLGSRKGALSVITYLSHAMLGLPVLAQGKFGIIGLLGPTGGYLLGFIFQAYITGRFTEKLKGFDSRKIIGILSLSCCVQLGLGVLWLSRFVGLDLAIKTGMYPFLFGEFIKVMAVVVYLKMAMPKKPTFQRLNF